MLPGERISTVVRDWHNLCFVQRIAKIAELAGRPPATPAQARAMLGLAGSSA